MFDFLETLFVSLFTTSDIVVLLWAAATFAMWFITRKQLKDVRKHLFTPGRRRSSTKTEETESEEEPDEDELYTRIGKLNRFYSLFTTFTSVFPLWGMLGTVKSLIEAAGNMAGGTPAVDKFFSALTSTAWGIIFAIIFKAGFDSFLSPSVEAANKEYDLLTERNTNILSGVKSED